MFKNNTNSLNKLAIKLKIEIIFKKLPLNYDNLSIILDKF